MRTWMRVAAGMAAMWSASGAAADIAVTRFDDPAPTGCTPADCSLREAIMLANTFSDPDRIVLQAGTYMLTIIAYDDDSQGGDLDITNDLTIVGAGSDQTTIAWFLAVDRIFDVKSPPPSAPGYHVKIAGMTLRGGGAPTGDGLVHDGGGIHTSGQNLNIQLTDVVLDGNSADGGSGGGAYIVGDRVTLDLVRATHNRANYEGGIGVGFFGDELSVLGLTLDGNHAQSCGGGGFLIIDNSGTKSIELRELLVRNNFADRNGGGLCAGAYRTGLILRDAVFDGNAAGGTFPGQGGALRSLSVTLDASSQFGTAIAIRSSTFTHNTATNGGGAIAFGDDAYGTTGDCDLTIESSTIADNEATDSFGGGVYLHPILSPTPCRFTLRSSRIEANAAKQGAGIYSAMDATTISNTTLVDNVGTLYGGAFETHDAIALVSGSTFAHNDGGQYGGAIEIFSDILSVADSTFYRNVATFGPTLDNNQSRTLFVADSTLVASGSLGSVYNNTGAIGTPHFDRSILAGSCSNDSPIGSYNLAMTASNCPFAEVPDDNLRLGPLADNGGPTETVLLQGDNAAIGYVPATSCTARDQREFLRLAPCDVGAVEMDGIDDFIFADAFET